MHKKLLITGYSGFVGCHLMEAVKNQYQLNLIGRKKSHRENVFCMPIDGSADLSQPFEGVDCVIHLAARVHVMNESDSNALSAFRDTNVGCTVALCKQAIKAGVKRFIYVSTIKVNGENSSVTQPFYCTDEPGPKDAYGQSKAEAELKLIELAKASEMEFVIIRPPLVYGAGVKANFASLMSLTAKRFPLPFGALSENRRSLVSVYNLVDLIKVCINHPNAKNKIFLVSDGQDLSTKKMVSLMAKTQGKKPVLLYVPAWLFKVAGKVFGKQDIVERLIGSLVVDISLTKRELNWEPPFSIEKGFEKTVEKN